MADTSKTTGRATEAQKAFAAVNDACREHVRELAHELLAWRRTGILQDGRLREVGAVLKPHMPHDYLSVAEKLAVDAALEAVAND